MKNLHLGLVFLLLAGVPVRADDTQIDLVNPGFEDGLNGWDANGGDNMSGATEEAAHSGKMGLEVIDTDDSKGSSLSSNHIAVKPGEVYEVHFWAKNISGSGTKVYLQFVGADGSKLTDISDAMDNTKKINIIALSIPSKTTDWQPFSLQGPAPDGATALYIWVHTSVKGSSTTYLDDFTLYKK
jgi:hypothetical protein